MEVSKLYTRDQNIKFLADDAIFAESKHLRTKAINQLARDYGMMAIPVIHEIASTLPAKEEEFILFCVNTISKLKEEEEKDSHNSSFN